MNLDSIVWGIGHFIEKTFPLIEKLNNYANYAIIAAAMAIALIWIYVQLHYTKRARREGTLI